MAATGRFHHEALFYSGDEEFVDRCRGFAEEGLDRDEPVLVMVGCRKLELLRGALGERAAAVQFADMEDVGRNPARIIPAWAHFVAASGGPSSGMRGIGEPIWADRRPDEIDECQLHESLINLAFVGANSFQLVCPYDTSALADEVIAEARHSHPVVSSDGSAAACGDYAGMDKVASRFSEPLPRPPPDAERLEVGVDDLSAARRLVRARAIAAGLGQRADDFALAASEVLSNSLQHAHESGTLRIWDEPDGIVCEVRDHGRILEPLVGRVEPAASQLGGKGIWLVNLVCDLVQVRSSEDGSTVRMKMGAKSG
ncbi:MAG: anti-sigma factor RsbA family regulatory protein [Thermoleophilaceae bacterium]